MRGNQLHRGPQTIHRKKRANPLCDFPPSVNSLAVDRLVINLAELPDEGQNFAGELPVELFELSGKDVRALSPLTFQIRAQQFENELLIMGFLEAAFEFTCARTLVRFKKTITLENAALSLEINGSSEVDPSDELREELLLEFPSYPRCDEGDDPIPCEIDPQYLAVDNRSEGDVESPPTPQGDSRWGALDALEEPDKES